MKNFLVNKKWGLIAIFPFVILSCPQCPPGTVESWKEALKDLSDKDKDGISDFIEDSILIKYSPYYLFDGGENFRPSDIDWYISRSELLPSGDEDDQAILSNPQLSNDINVLLSANRTDDHGRYCSVQNNVWDCKSDIYTNPRRTLYHLNPLANEENDSDNSWRRGESWTEVEAKKNVGLYGHVTLADYNWKRGDAPNKKENLPLYKIEYWQFYPYNWMDRGDYGDHEGEWELVQLLIDKKTGEITTVFYYIHGEEVRFDKASGTMDSFPISNLPFKAYEYRGSNYNIGYNRWENNVSLKLPDQRANANLLRLAWDEKTKQYTHPMAYIEEGTHAPWPSEFWDVCQMGFCSWSHAGDGHRYLSNGTNRNLGEVKYPLNKVKGAQLILRYNGYWGAFSKSISFLGLTTDPPPGPQLHTQWNWPSNNDTLFNKIPKDAFTN